MTRINPTYGRPYPPPARHPASLGRLFRLLRSTDWTGCSFDELSRLWRAIHRAA